MRKNKEQNRMGKGEWEGKKRRIKKRKRNFLMTKMERDGESGREGVRWDKDPCRTTRWMRKKAVNSLITNIENFELWRSNYVDRVVTHPDNGVHVRRTSGRVRRPHGRPPWRPSTKRTAKPSVVRWLPWPVDGGANSPPTAERGGHPLDMNF
jgi:hypothetical protein